MKNNSENPRLTHEVWLHPVKAGVWLDVRATRIALLCFFKGTINCERYVQVIFRQFFRELQKKKDSMAGISKAQLLPTLHVCLCRLCLVSLGTEISTLVFGRHIHQTLILTYFLMWFIAGQCLKQ
jgi:hypothetical protein